MATQLALVVGKTRQQFEEEITRSWQKNVDGIIDTAWMVLDAKEGPNKLPHGEFEAMVESDRLPFGPRTARRLMSIARKEVISNRTHGSVLPASWRTLYELTRLSDEIIEARIADGTINPRMQRKDAVALRRPPPEPDALKLPASPHADCVQLERLSRRWDDHALAAAIQRVMMAGFRSEDAPRGDGTAEAAQRTIMELRRWADMIERGME